MIVRDAGSAWQVVLQTDHAALSGQIAAAWGDGDGVARVEPYAPVVTASTRHDDGWAVWERAPALGHDGAPLNFLAAKVLTHLDLWRAAVTAVSEQDPYAGLLVAMHGAGIYNGRHGTQPSLEPTLSGDVKERVEAFVAEQGELRARRVAELGLREHELWTNYKLLQVYDRLSLDCCAQDLEGAAVSGSIAPAPLDYSGSETELSIESIDACRLRIEPYPFGRSPASFSVRFRRVEKRPWEDDESFRRDFFATHVETLEIGFERA